MKKSAFGFDKPEDSPGFLLWQTTITWQRLIKKCLDPHTISHAQFVILAISLWLESQDQEVSQSLVVRQSRLDKMTVSKACKKLAKEGYLKRLEHKIDMRSKTIHLTKRGKELISTLIPIIEKIDEDFFGLVKKSDRKSLMNILHSIVSAMDVTDE